MFPLKSALFPLKTNSELQQSSSISILLFVIVTPLKLKALIPIPAVIMLLLLISILVEVFFKLAFEPEIYSLISFFSSQV